jgi:hypothetical protein
MRPIVIVCFFGGIKSAVALCPHAARRCGSRLLSFIRITPQHPRASNVSDLLRVSW